MTGWRLGMTADVRAWLADLAARDPLAALRVGAAVLALLDQGTELGPPLVAAVAYWPATAAGQQEPDLRAALDNAYNRLLEELTDARREAADIYVLRERVEQQFAGIPPDAPEEETTGLRRSATKLAEAEREISESIQLLQERADAFRAQKEAVKAAYAAAAGSAAASEVFARFGEPEPPVDTDAALADAKVRAQRLLRLMLESEPAKDASPAPLLALRPYAPACLATRILFTVRHHTAVSRVTRQRIGHDPGKPGSAVTEPLGMSTEVHTEHTIVLLAAGTEHTRPDGPDRLIALARARAAEDPLPGWHDGDTFAAEFFPGREDELVAEVAALARASQRLRLAGLRERAGLTREKLAEELGEPPERVAEIENTDLGASGLGALAAYVRALGGTLDSSADLGTQRIPLT